MISFDFDYYRPDSIEEAIKTYKKLTEQGKKVIYYAGGTEIISGARVNRIRFDAVIDIKRIPECNVLEFRADKLIIGAAVSLTKISDSGLFPLLGAVCRRSADHTARDKITLGGNICGKTPYKEAILPLLLVDSEVVIASESGMKSLPLTQIFDKEVLLNGGEFLAQIIIDKSYIILPYINIKKTKQEKVDYPLVTVVSVKMGNRIRVAFSGLCPYPFRLYAGEGEYNNKHASLEKRIDNVMRHLPATILSDILGTAEYREFIAKNVLSKIIEKSGGIE